MSLVPDKERRTATAVVQRPWSADEDVLLRELIERNRSAAQAATEIGRSRSSVLGRAFRLGLGFHGEGLNTPRFFSTKRLRTTEIDPKRLERIELFRRYAEEADPSEDRSTARTFLEAMGRPVCTWFFKGEEGRNGLVCGARSLPGKAYCAHHQTKSVAPPDEADEVGEVAA
jgi:hypothetical protein